MALHRRMGVVKPAPFKRKSISISLEPGKKRVWNHIPVVMVEIGDIIAEFGLVEDVGSENNSHTILLVNQLGETKRVGWNETILAFH